MKLLGKRCQPYWNHVVKFKAHMSLLLVLSAANLQTVAAAGVTYCPVNQTAELGKPSTIDCNFPHSFYAVFWFANITSEGLPLVVYLRHSSEKRGTGFLDGSFDVTRNGSLVIPNVRAEHEGNYTVIMYKDPDAFDKNNVSVKVVAFPRNGSLRIECVNCQQNYYHVGKGNKTLTCSLNISRPPARLEWFQRFPHGDVPVENHITIIADNKDGTYNSSTTVHLTRSDDCQITEFVCRAWWDSSMRVREKHMLLDFSHRESFLGLEKDTLYRQVNRKSVLRCEGSKQGPKIWKRIFPLREPETIGFSTGNVTRMTTKHFGMGISTDGSLVFSALQIDHEGLYACLYGDGKENEMKMKKVVVLVPPSPPFLQIKGCNENGPEPCEFKEENTDRVSCAVYGTRPDVFLQWNARKPNYIFLSSPNRSVTERGETFDVAVETKFEIYKDVPCEEKLFIECHLYGPIEKIMKANEIAQVTPKSCKTKESTWKFQVVFAVVGIICIVIIVPLIIHSKRKYYLCQREEEGTKRRSAGSLVSRLLPSCGRVTTVTDSPEDRISQREEEGTKRRSAGSLVSRLLPSCGRVTTVTDSPEDRICQREEEGTKRRSAGSLVSRLLPSCGRVTTVTDSPEDRRFSREEEETKQRSGLVSKLDTSYGTIPTGTDASGNRSNLCVV